LAIRCVSLVWWLIRTRESTGFVVDYHPNRFNFLDYACVGFGLG
jgi:hypothetical protein